MDIYLYIDIFFLEYERANFICVHIKYGFNQRGLWRNERETVKDNNEDIVKLRSIILIKTDKLFLKVLKMLCEDEKKLNEWNIVFNLCRND